MLTKGFELGTSGLALIRLMCGCLARTGGWHQKPPVSIIAQKQILAQNSCFPKGCHQFQLIWPLFRYFFLKKAIIENISKN